MCKDGGSGGGGRQLPSPSYPEVTSPAPGVAPLQPAAALSTPPQPGTLFSTGALRVDAA